MIYLLIASGLCIFLLINKETWNDNANLRGKQELFYSTFWLKGKLELSRGNIFKILWGRIEVDVSRVMLIPVGSGRQDRSEGDMMIIRWSKRCLHPFKFCLKHHVMVYWGTSKVSPCLFFLMFLCTSSSLEPRHFNKICLSFVQWLAYGSPSLFTLLWLCV